MPHTYTHLDVYSDLVRAAKRSSDLYQARRPGRATQQLLRKTLSFSPGPAKPRSVTVEQEWTRNGIHGELVTWWVGYGPRTEAYLLKPAGVKGRLPGIIALHDHGGFKTHGKEKIADGPGRLPKSVKGLRDRCYQGVAFANRLAKQGYVVLVPDCFLWGSRRFPLKAMESIRDLTRVANYDSLGFQDGKTIEYNSLAANHEHVVEKYCRVLGMTLSGVISYEDRVALAYLLSRKDVMPEGAGCVGLSGGGLRSGLLHATSDSISAAVIVGMMTTYAGLLDRNVRSHTWMLYLADWARHGDYPDAIACRAPSPLMVQFNADDALFTSPGMKAAHRKLLARYREVDAANRYVGRFYNGPHQFDIKMQDEAFKWLGKWMRTVKRQR